MPAVPDLGMHTSPSFYAILSPGMGGGHAAMPALAACRGTSGVILHAKPVQTICLCFVHRILLSPHDRSASSIQLGMAEKRLGRHETGRSKTGCTPSGPGS